MCADDLAQVLLHASDDLNAGFWRPVRRPPEFEGHPIAGPEHLVRCATALRLTARSMQRQAQGQVQGAWELLGQAAALLPLQLVRRSRLTGVALAVLRPLPADGDPDEVKLVVGIARLIYREQFELAELRDRFAPGKTKARDQLIEGCIRYLGWVQFDPGTFYRTSRRGSMWDDGTTVEPSRRVICGFGTAVRRFGDPTADTDLSQAPWQDIGGYRGLAAAALDRLAERPAATPWCEASGLVARRGCLRAWEYAQQRREDLDEQRRGDLDRQRREDLDSA